MTSDAAKWAKIHCNDAWQLMIRLSLKFARLVIFTQGTRLWCQKWTISTYCEGLNCHCDVKYDVRYDKMAKKSIQMMLVCQQMIRFSKIVISKLSEGLRSHHDVRIYNMAKNCLSLNVKIHGLFYVKYGQISHSWIWMNILRKLCLV